MGRSLPFLGVSLVFIFIIVIIQAQKDEKACEVCIATLDKFKQELPSGMHNDTNKLESRFRSFCKKQAKGGKENRFCYFVGGTADAATGTIMNVINPLSYDLPSSKICKQLNARDGQICDLRFDVRPDFSKLTKMKVGELRKILSHWGETMACAGCVEKADYVKAVRRLMPKYEPAEWAKIQAAEKTEL